MLCSYAAHYRARKVTVPSAWYRYVKKYQFGRQLENWHSAQTAPFHRFIGRVMVFSRLNRLLYKCGCDL
jgi:hypothetical protein